MFEFKETESSELTVSSTPETAWEAAAPLGLPASKPSSAHEPIYVSPRWLIGTALTGCFGMFLLGSPIYAVFDHQAILAEPPQWRGMYAKDTAVGEFVNPKKNDRLMKVVETVGAKKLFHAPVSFSNANREVIRNKVFAHISTPLPLNSSDLAEDIPAFNALKMLSGVDEKVVDTSQSFELLQNDQDVSYTMRDIQSQDQALARVGLTLKEVEAQISASLQVDSATGVVTASSIAIPPQLLLMKTSQAALSLPSLGPRLETGEEPVSSPFSSIEVKMIPENVSFIPKSTPGDDQERLITMRRGEGFEDVLKNSGANKEDIRALTRAISASRTPQPSGEGQKLKLLFFPNEQTAQADLAKISLYKDDVLQAALARDDDGRYVKIASLDTKGIVNKKKDTGDSADDDEDEGDQGSSNISLYKSVYETALKQKMPRPLVEDMIKVLANDIDFQRATMPGDSLDVLFSEKDDTDQKPDLLYAALNVRGETYKYYRFQSLNDNVVAYYDETGRSARKFLVRQPISGARFTSGFGSRFHPILGYTRRHTGVDWAAPIGTPIYAAGNGTVIMAQRESGYGNRIEIQHSNGYVTTYNHLSGFARGLKESDRVRQGQVIGYLGMTGLSTGPHLHYEVLVNGQFVDPLRVKLARTHELDGQQLALFKREKDRLEDLLTKPADKLVAP